MKEFNPELLISTYSYMNEREKADADFKSLKSDIDDIINNPKSALRIASYGLQKILYTHPQFYGVIFLLMSEIYDDEITDELVNNTDARDLADRIINIINDPHRAGAFSATIIKMILPERKFAEMDKKARAAAEELFNELRKNARA